jgi:hypothetical protein
MTPCTLPNGQVGTITELGCFPNDPASFVSNFYGVGLSIIGGVSVLFIIYGGYIVLTSQGSPSQLEKGRSYIFYAIAGLLLAIFGYAFFKFIAVDILRIPGIQ